MFIYLILWVAKTRKSPTKRATAESNVVDDPAVDDPVEPETSPSPKKLHQDHDYHVVESPRKLKQRLEDSYGQVVTLKRQLKCNKQKSRRLKKSVTSLKTVVKHLSQKQIISPSCEEMLNQTFSGASLDLMKRITSGRKSGKGSKYLPELKSFALTLQFYSAKAYEFVRRTFNLALPHQSQIRWYSKIPADPGFTQPASLSSILSPPSTSPPVPSLPFPHPSLSPIPPFPPTPSLPSPTPSLHLCSPTLMF